MRIVGGTFQQLDKQEHNETDGGARQVANALGKRHMVKRRRGSSLSTWQRSQSQPVKRTMAGLLLSHDSQCEVSSSDAVPPKPVLNRLAERSVGLTARVSLIAHSMSTPPIGKEHGILTRGGITFNASITGRIGRLVRRNWIKIRKKTNFQRQ